MSVFDTLSLSERARQLRQPEGNIGIAVAHWTSEANRQGIADTVAFLGIETGNRVLEIGFGDGSAVRDVLAQASSVRYVGLDISPTMVEEARRLNAPLAADGSATFHLGSADAMPFADDSFDRIFSIGVIHFWDDPEAALKEVRRVLRPGGLMRMGCVAPEGAPDFARPEYGFHLRDAATWDALCRSAGFANSAAELFVLEKSRPDGTAVKVYRMAVTARG